MELFGFVWVWFLDTGVIDGEIEGHAKVKDSLRLFPGHELTISGFTNYE